jgi:hypothetical protein
LACPTFRVCTSCTKGHRGGGGIITIVTRRASRTIKTRSKRIRTRGTRLGGGGSQGTFKPSWTDRTISITRITVFTHVAYFGTGSKVAALETSWTIAAYGGAFKGVLTRVTFDRSRRFRETVGASRAQVTSGLVAH